MREVVFSGRRWTVKTAAKTGPGPNTFDERNVSIAANGDLRLDVANREGMWTCAEVQTAERLGFGTVQFWLVGRVDLLDPQLVFGCFTYPTPDVGPSGTHEIDIEFARWGKRQNRCGNFIVYPTRKSGSKLTHAFAIDLEGDHTTHRIVRGAKSIVFSSYHGHRQIGDPRGLIDVREFTGDFSESPMPLHLNFWLYEGRAPQNGQGASLTVRALQFVASTLSDDLA